MSGPVPYQGPQPYSPYQGLSPPSSKRTSTAAIVIVVVLVIVVIIGIGIVFMFVMFGSLLDESWDETRDVETDVFIADGGHFRLLLSEDWEEEMEVNLTITILEGGNFDVYVMTEEQYENAYGNRSSGAFSSTLSWHNASIVHDIVTISDIRETYYLVIDNVEMPHVPGNAVPEGPIHVDVEVHLLYRYNLDV